MLKKVNVVVFDFDGTLSASDSNLEFGKYCFAHSVRPWIYLPLFLTGVLVHFVNRRSIWSRQIMRRFVTPKMVEKFAPIVIRAHKKNRFGWAADRVAAERAAGNICILISASADYLIPGLVRDMKFDAVITSKMEKSRPWKYKFMCWGKNKVVALDDWAKKNKVTPHVVRAYGDSKSDKYIMNLADMPIWINRKTGLPR